MTTFSDLLVEVGVFTHVIAHAEKGGFTLYLSSWSNTQGDLGMGPSSKVRYTVFGVAFSRAKGVGIETLYSNGVVRSSYVS